MGSIGEQLPGQPRDGQAWVLPGPAPDAAHQLPATGPSRGPGTAQSQHGQGSGQAVDPAARHPAPSGGQERRVCCHSVLLSVLCIKPRLSTHAAPTEPQSPRVRGLALPAPPPPGAEGPPKPHPLWARAVGTGSPGGATQGSPSGQGPQGSSPATGGAHTSHRGQRRPSACTASALACHSLPCPGEPAT